jgi:hypothetical protein
LHDRVLRGAAAARAARSPVARAAQQTYTTPDGYRIPVVVSPAYASDPAKVQGFVDFLSSRMHGFELGRISLQIATPSEVGVLCGGDALACYLPGRQLMVIPGEQTPSGEVPLEFVITHEYGHHIALFRSNDPWPAVSWGPKYWSTDEHVCAGVFENIFFPGDEGEHYLANPGENWAESYAVYHYRDAQWHFFPTFKPDENAFAAILRDVTQPWHRPPARTVRGSFSRAHHRARRFTIHDTLDGRVSLMLRGPRHTNFDLRVLAGGRRADGTQTAGSHDRLRGDVCNQPRLTVQVVRRAGFGRFKLRISAPG